MGLFDFLKKKEAPRSRPLSNSVTVNHRAPVNRPTPVRKEEAKPKKIPLKVTDTSELEKHLQLDGQLPDNEMLLFCPIRNAKIYCHSVLIDKLGDLTKFIITSLYEGHTIDEISALTQMGPTTVKEELEYLIRGGLVDDDGSSLTELGNQYGKLLELFDTLSDGIAVAFNVFTDEFEPIDEVKYVRESNPQYTLPGHYNPVLARNDNYANSLRIAQQHIISEMPFCYEIKKSLYATVKIDKEETGFKVARIKDFDKGTQTEIANCIKLFIPYDRITYRPRYTRLDQYRGILPQLLIISNQCDEMLTDKAKQVIGMSQEEDLAKTFTKEVNTVSGTIERIRRDLISLPDENTGFLLGRHPVCLNLNSEQCNDLYLEEVGREQLYRVCYYAYKWMEV